MTHLFQFLLEITANQIKLSNPNKISEYYKRFENDIYNKVGGITENN
jgi:hypothetical protein